MVKREVSIESRVEKAIAFKGRIQILEMIKEKPMYCEEIAKIQDRKPSGTFQHCKQLENAGLIIGSKGEENDRNVIYKITESGLSVLAGL